MKHIKITEDLEKEVLEHVKAQLKQTRISDRSNALQISLDNVIQSSEQYKKAELYITTQAYLKMMMYVRDCDIEIAWHGTATRKGNTYAIKDVMLYPQTITAATVNTDDVEYANWLNGLDDDTFNELRFQGHSHVNMGVSPSGIDLGFYDKILQTIGDSDFYIFMIMNKHGDMMFIIYDLAANIIYNTEDINVTVLDSTKQINLLTKNLEDKTKYCKRYTPTYPPLQKTQFWEKDTEEENNNDDYSGYSAESQAFFEEMWPSHSKAKKKGKK